MLLSGAMLMQCVAVAAAHGADDGGNTVFKKSAQDISLSELTGGKASEPGFFGYEDDDYVQAIIELEEESLLCSDVKTDELEARWEELVLQQEIVLSEIAAMMGADFLTADFRYTLTVNGFSAEVPYGLLDEIAALDGVADVHVAARFQTPEEVTVLSASNGSVPTVNEMVGGDGALELGYDGTGMLVAVIDTGIDVDHPAFADNLDEDQIALTRDEVADILDKLNASQLYEELAVEDVYYSNKIPFGFNYIDNSVDISHENDNAGDHGTHVAGILAAGGEDSEIVGVAPGAQLIVMKVFSQSEEDASEAALVAAVEDAVALGADVINLSLGGAVGFSQEGTTLAKTLQCAMDSGVVVCAAAGNEASSAYKNVYGQNLSKTSNMDIGVICSPASLDGVLAVASVEYGVSYSEGFLVSLPDGGEEFISYSDSGTLYGIDSFSSLMEKAGMYEYVCVPGVGSESDYEGLDVEGKIALIQRGEITFAEKSDHAFWAGAVAAIVYNNVDEAVNMDLTGVSPDNDNPCVFIGTEEGSMLVELAGEDGVGSLTLTDEIRQVQTEYGGQPSSFSSWGALPDLTLKPEFSGVGGNVYSATDGGTYGVMSGTSMATPQVSGAMILLLQYLKEEHELTGVQAARLARTLLMNTAAPAEQSDGVKYSPRKQGAGLIDVKKAMSTDVYLTVNGNDLPKAELGDDKSQSGIYTFNLVLHNMSNEARSFVTSASILTECAENGYMLQWAREADAGVTIISIDSQQRYLYDLNENGVLDENDAEGLRNLLTTLTDENVLALYDLNQDGATDGQDANLLARAIAGKCEAPAGLDRVLVTVPAGGKTELHVRISLTEKEKRTLKSDFENGVYIEGYVTLDSYSGQEAALSVPFVGFFGDWTKAPLFETTYLAQTEAELWDGVSGNCPATFEIITGEESYLGMNPVTYDEEYLPERSNALNLTGEEGGVISDIYLDLLRSARSVSVEMVSKSGVALYQSCADEVPKSYYSDQYGMMIPTVWSLMDEEFFFDPNEYGLEDGDEFILRIAGQKDYAGAYAREVIEIPVYLDGTEPEVLDVQVTRSDDLSESCEVTVVARDERYISGVLLLAADGKSIVETYTVNQREPGEEITLTLDVTEEIFRIGGEFMIGVVDYAQNMSVYEVCVLEDDERSLLSEGTMLAYGTDFSGDGWSVFGLAGQGIVTAGFWNYLGDVCAAEAVGDTIFAILDEATDELYAIDAATFQPEYTFDLGLEAYMDQVLDMAYCTDDGLLYLLVYTGFDYELLQVDLRRESTQLLTTVGRGHTESAGAYAVACGPDGTLYLIAGVESARTGKEMAVLYAVDRGNGSLKQLCALGIELENSVISAAVDQSSGVLYFTHYSCRYDLTNGTVSEEQSSLYSWNSAKRKAKPVEVRDLGSACYEALTMTGVPEEWFDPQDAATELILSCQEQYLVEGRQFRLEAAEYRPWYVEPKGYALSFDSGDASVVWVDAEGLVTAVGAGETEITVTATREGNEALTAVCRVTVKADSFFGALRGGEWINVSAGTMQARPLSGQMTAEASVAAFGAGAGPEGQDVVFVIDKGQIPEDGTVPVYTLYCYDAEHFQLLGCEALKDRWSLLGNEIPVGGFADMAFDPTRQMLVAVSGGKCYAVDPVSWAIDRIYTVEACPEDCSLVGITYDSAGTGWLVDSEGTLYQIDGYFGYSAVCHPMAELGLHVSEPGGASLEYDQLRNVLWFRCGRSMYAIDPAAEQLCAERQGSLPWNVTCLFMGRF